MVLGVGHYALDSENKIRRLKETDKPLAGEDLVEFVLTDHLDYNEGNLVFDCDKMTPIIAEKHSPNYRRIVMSTIDEHLKKEDVERLPQAYIDIFVKNHNNLKE